MKKLTAVAVLVAAAGIAALAGVQIGTGGSAKAAPSGCNLGNGVQHVINIVFDNVHFSRDNPNVPSDLEQMPHLLNFLKQYGTVFSNSHTPLIAHTANDSLTIYTGLYGDRHGQPLTNSYKTYNPDGSTDPATSFTYWTSPIIDTKTNPPKPNTVDTTPSMAYAGGGVTPAPWVPFTRAGCTVGDFSTANMVLENAAGDVPTAFGANSPEAAQTAADPDNFKDVEVAQYVGEAVHCAHGSAVCTNSSRAVPDVLPNEPGGYDNYQALFGAKYIAPALAPGPNYVSPSGYQVTDANGNLVDLNGNTLQEPFSHTPGFPGFSPTATQSLAVIADMQEAGIPVTYGYISDLHEKKADTTTGCTTANSPFSGRPVGPGDSCYVTNAQHYDAAFNTFFQRLQADGITPANTLFVISSEENDQFAGANVGRATEPTPAGCDGVTTPCHYASGQIGELQANVKGLLATSASANTAFDIEPQGASIYVHGNPAADDPAVRQLERDTAAMTNPLDPYSGVTNEKIVKYQAGALEQRVLHMQTIDPLRTPTYTLFPKPDYFFSTTGANVSINDRFAYDHGYYSPNIDVTWVGFAGKGVKVNGVDGPDPAQGNQPTDPESQNTVPQASTVGTWVEETDIRPTMLSLLGLTDDYRSDGHVITQALDHVPAALQATAELAKGYDQIESSVGQFATDTLIADTKALASGSSSDDSAYEAEQATLAQLADDRDTAVAAIKKVLNNAAAGVMPNHGQVTSGLAHVRELLRRAALLAASS
jgi:type II secretory pathway pseudopilin PulG